MPRFLIPSVFDCASRRGKSFLVISCEKFCRKWKSRREESDPLINFAFCFYIICTQENNVQNLIERIFYSYFFTKQVVDLSQNQLKGINPLLIVRVRGAPEEDAGASATSADGKNVSEKACTHRQPGPFVDAYPMRNVEELHLNGYGVGRCIPWLGCLSRKGFC